MDQKAIAIAAKSLQVARLNVRAGGHQLLSDVSFSLHPGELGAVIGPSGSGKSTLLKTILGIRTPGSGQVTGRGVPGDTGYVPQFVALHKVLSVRQSLDFALQLRCPTLDETARAERVAAVCAELRLQDRLDVTVRRLSGGQQKRVAIAMELLTQPKWLILDEPASGLDPGLEAELMERLRALAAQGRVVLTTTHAMSSLPLCAALFILKDGFLVFAGAPPDALKFFEVQRFEDIFPVLVSKTAQTWSTQYQASPFRRAAERRTPSKGDGV
jgi:ABC-type multidrug transport system ATPase subunit